MATICLGLNVLRYCVHDLVVVCFVVVMSSVFVDLWHTINHILQGRFFPAHYSDVIMGTIASQITSLTIVYSTVYSDADQRKHQSSASLAFVRGIHRGPVNSPHKWPVTRKMFPFDDFIMIKCIYNLYHSSTLPCDTGSRNPFSCKTRTHLVYIVNIMGADALMRQGARASATLILTMLNRNDSVPTR